MRQFLRHIEMTKYFNYEPRFNVVSFPKDELTRTKDGVFVKYLTTKKLNEHTGFHYLFTKIRLHNLIRSELNVFLQEVLTKTKGNSITYKNLEYNLITLLCEYMLAGKLC